MIHRFMAAPWAQNHAAIAQGATVAVEAMADLEIQYRFTNADNEQRYRVLPKNIVRAEGQPDRMCLRGSDGMLAKFIFAGSGHHAHQKDYSLSKHRGFLQLLVLRNTAHAASNTSSSNVGGTGSASTSAVSSIFKRASAVVSPEAAFRRGRQTPLESAADADDLVEIELSPETRIPVGRPNKASDPLVVPISKANMMAIVAFIKHSHDEEQSFQRQRTYELSGRYKGGYQKKGFGGPRTARKRQARGSYKDRWDAHGTESAKRRKVKPAASLESDDSSAHCAEGAGSDDEDEASDGQDESSLEEGHAIDMHVDRNHEHGNLEDGASLPAPDVAEDGLRDAEPGDA